MRDMDAENLNLYHEKMYQIYASVLEGIEHVGKSKAEIKHN